MNMPINPAALLKATVGRTLPPMNSRMIGHLDQLALRWIAASPLMFAAFGDSSGLGTTLGGGEAGFASADTYELRLPVEKLDDPAMVVPGQGFGSLFLLPCVGETMRVNGTVRQVRDGIVRIAVEECYGHSDRALVRSEFWAALLQRLAPQHVSAFAATSRFMALATVDEEGRVELSPKDDPAGILRRIETGRAGLADGGHFHGRAQPQAAAMVLILGSGQVARVSGNARITADQTVSSQFVFRDETSAMAAIVEDAVEAIGESATLLRLAGSVQFNQDKGLGAELASAAVSVPGVSDFLRKGLETGHMDTICAAS